jgi:hypothetical protein
MGRPEFRRLSLIYIVVTTSVAGWFSAFTLVPVTHVWKSQTFAPRRKRPNSCCLYSGEIREIRLAHKMSRVRFRKSANLLASVSSIGI